MNYLPEGRPPTFYDLRSLLTNNTACRTIWNMYEVGDLTHQQMLISMILALADHNDFLQKYALESSLKQKTVFLNPKEENK